MNSKLCKKLRRIARHDMAQRANLEQRVFMTRRLLLAPDHKTAVNDPDTWRGTYRRLKKEYRYGPR